MRMNRNYFRLDLSRRSVNPDSSKEKVETLPGYMTRTKSSPESSTGSSGLILENLLCPAPCLVAVYGTSEVLCRNHDYAIITQIVAKTD